MLCVRLHAEFQSFSLLLAAILSAEFSYKGRSLQLFFERIEPFFKGIDATDACFRVTLSYCIHLRSRNLDSLFSLARIKFLS